MIKFGTSGFRGIIGDNFNKENLYKLGYALKVLNNKLQLKKITLGYDNRFLSVQFLKWFLEAFYSENIDIVFYSRSVPSPLISYESKNNNLGIIITASHNPYEYNGIKIFLNAQEPSSEIALDIENLANSINYEDISFIPFNEIQKKKNFKFSTSIENYSNSVLNLIDKEKINKNIKVCYNNMYGSALECARYIFDKLGLEKVKILNDNIDPYFNFRLPAPYENNLTEQVEFIVKNNYDIGFAVDGDGDRFTAIDKSGKIYNCNYIMAIMYYYFLKYKNYKGDIVLDVAITGLINKIAEKFNFKALDSVHGFKNIGNNILNSSAFMGGESNGIAFKEHLLTKDGIVTIPILLEILSQTKMSLTELVELLEKELNYKSVLKEVNFNLTLKEKENLNKQIFIDKKVPELKDNIIKISYFDGLKITFENNYWLCIRFSGNENVIRVFIEQDTEKHCDEILLELQKQYNLYNIQ